MGLVGVLLRFMDGVSKNDIMFIGATNRIDSIDEALLRAGRFGRSVEFGLPDKEGRKEVFSVCINDVAGKYEEEEGAIEQGKKLFGDIDFERLVDATEKASGADIAEIIRRTMVNRIKRENDTGEEQPQVSTKDIETVIDEYDKFSKESDEDKYRRTYGII